MVRLHARNGRGCTYLGKRVDEMDYWKLLRRSKGQDMTPVKYNGNTDEELKEALCCDTVDVGTRWVMLLMMEKDSV
jgi:hypothetical protein